ncbi:MAG: ribose 5-phosphate isomerase B [Armatimonadetes bacterium]|nr:ribose 5-phosphate isomerase B [Armatimonadota bacterium]
MKLVIGADHAGFELASELAAHLVTLGHQVEQVGANSTERYDYPDASDLVAASLLGNQAEFGILVCGSGIGVSIRANRYMHVRAALCTSVEMAELARQHNRANVLCLGARILTGDLAKEITETFLKTPEDPSERHALRVKKLDSPLNC